MSVGQAADSRQQPAPHVTKAKRFGSHRFAKLRLHVANIYRLTIKELRSFRSDPIMLALVAYAFQDGLAIQGWHWAGLLGVVPLVTAFFRNCPLYTALGISSCPVRQ